MSTEPTADTAPTICPRCGLLTDGYTHLTRCPTTTGETTMTFPPPTTARLRCDMDHDCDQPPSMLDNKGYIYCAEHGIARRDWRPCRKLRPHELRRIARGEQITRY